MLARNTEYAIRGLVYIQLQNWREKRPGVIEIAKAIESPKAYMAKILQVLTRHNIIDSRKGRGGGFFFGGDQADLTLYEIIHVMEGDARLKKCGFGYKQCSDDNPCPLHDSYAALRDKFFNMARTQTIQNISQRIADGKAFLKPERSNV